MFALIDWELCLRQIVLKKNFRVQNVHIVITFHMYSVTFVVSICEKISLQCK